MTNRYKNHIIKEKKECLKKTQEQNSFSKIPNIEEYVDMCKAEREWEEKEVEAGRKDERAKMMKGYLTLINENKISFEDAATALNMSVEEFKKESNI